MAVHASDRAPEFVSANRDGATSRRQFLLLIGMLVTLAWFTLWIWERSPYGRYLDHGRWTEIGLAGRLCGILPNGDVRREALCIGVDHGIYCVGCCWALMLLMFVVGTGSVGWMLLLGVVMAIEKNVPAGRHLSKPLGGALIAGAIFVTVQNSALWSLS